MTKVKKGDRVILPFNVSCGGYNNAIDRNHYTLLPLEEASKAYGDSKTLNRVSMLLFLWKNREWFKLTEYWFNSILFNRKDRFIDLAHIGRNG